MNNLQKEVMETAEALKKSIGGAKFDSAKAIKNVVDVTSKANKLKKESIQIDKLKKDAMIQESKALQELEKIEQQKLKTQSQQMRNDKQQSQEKERLNKTNQKAVKVAKDEASAYKKLEKNTRALKNQSKELGAQMLILEQSGKKNTKAYRDLSTQYRKTTASAKQGDKALKKLDKSVGDNFRNVGNYKDAIKGLVGVLGTLGASVGIGQIFKNITGTIIEFDQAQADLTAISGKTKDELADLTQQAKELGATTQFTATQITEMQIELAKLGFTTTEIEASTEAVSNFASATGADLASASKVAGATLRAFGLDASEMERVVSTLGVATTKSALSFQSFETGMSTIAPVASAFGFSVEDTTALLGQLADSGFDASSSATATRNILLNLADANGDLAKELGRPIKSADDLAEGLKELQEKGIDLATALELTDKRSVAAFQTFLNGSKDLVKFRDSITDVNQELEDMAKKRLDSVQGQLTLLNSAWEGFILNMGDASGASNTMKTAIGFLANNLTQILNVIGKLIRGFVLYKATMAGLKVVQFAVNGGFKDMGKLMLKQIPLTKQYALAQKESAVATKQSGVAVKGFGKAFASIGIFLLITAVTELAMAWYDVASGAKQAREEEALRAEQKEIIDNREALGQNLASKRSKALNDERQREFMIIDRNIRKQKLLIDQSLKENEIKKKTAELDKSAIAQKKVVLFLQQQGLGGEVVKLEEELDQARSRLVAEQNKKTMEMEDILVYNSKTDSMVSTGKKRATGRMIADVDPLRVATTAGEVAKLEAMLKKMRGDLGLTNDQFEDMDLNLQEFDQRMRKGAKTTKGKTKAVKTYNTEFKKTNEFISEQIKLLQDLQKIEQDRELINQQKGIDAEFNAQIKNIEETGKFDADQLNKLIQDKVETETRYIEQRTEVAKQSLLDQYDFEKNARLQALKDERDALIEKAKENKDAIKTIEENYQIELKDLQNEELERELDNDLKIENLEQTKTNNILKIQEDGYKSQEELLSEFTDKVIEYNDQQLEKTKDIYKSISELVKISTDYFIKQSQKKIDQINKEINKAQEQYDYFKQLAINGNLDAKDSLAEQQKIINEANKKKLQEEKRQQRIRMAESVFSTYSSKVESGSKNPLAETIRDTSLLLQFINSIPAFYDGTEDTGSTGKGVDGRGGFHAVLHPNERVLPKSLNQQIGDLSNEELTRLAVDYKNGRVIEGASQTSSAMDLAILVNELSDIKRTIENKPETNIELGQITQSMMEVVKSTKKGNTIVYNRYKIKK